MPCRDYYPGDEPTIREVENPKTLKRLDQVTALLCAVCRKLKPSTINSVPGLATWWDDHQKRDMARVQETLRAERLKQRKQRALAKLSEQERKLLGL